MSDFHLKRSEIKSRIVEAVAPSTIYCLPSYTLTGTEDSVHITSDIFMNLSRYFSLFLGVNIKWYTWNETSLISFEPQIII